ncbi:MAG: RNA methyltransferase [Candidatus Atribacteria bacterium]|nr:RNA methyltransferase [Candidatus Atribacteria bacterium]
MKHAQEIISKENSIYRMIKGLKQKKMRESTQLYLLEGSRLVEEAISRGAKIKYVLMDETIESELKLIQNYQTLRLANQLFKGISDTVHSQGIIAVVEKEEIQLEGLVLDENPLIVVLDGIQDPGNLGTMIRTSAAAKATAVLLTKGTVDLFNPKVIRSTMGSVFQIPIVRNIDDEAMIQWLNDHSINILVADLESKEYYFSINLKAPFALVIGNENKGPKEIWKNSALKIIKIPILGSTESLNASVAAGIILFDAVRQRLTH